MPPLAVSGFLSGGGSAPGLGRDGWPHGTCQGPGLRGAQGRAGAWLRSKPGSHSALGRDGQARAGMGVGAEQEEDLGRGRGLQMAGHRIKPQARQTAGVGATAKNSKKPPTKPRLPPWLHSPKTGRGGPHLTLYPHPLPSASFSTPCTEPRAGPLPAAAPGPPRPQPGRLPFLPFCMLPRCDRSDPQHYYYY